jgi:hypothetical protein
VTSIWSTTVWRRRIHPHLRLVLYTPVLATDTPQRLRQLVGEETRA